MFEFVDAKLFLVSAVCAAIYFYLKYCVYNYWKKHGIPHESPSIPFGNIPWTYFFGSIYIGDFFKKTYEKFSRYPFYGIYILHKPVLVVNDPELLRTILVKEFNKFGERGIFMDEKVDPMSANLFLLPHERWKILRTKISPTYTPRRLREVYPLMAEVSTAMIETCENDLKNTDVLEIRDVILRYATDIISTIVYGFNCNSLKNPNNDFRYFGTKGLKIGRIVLLLVTFFPDLAKKISMPFFNADSREFFEKIFRETIDYRHNKNVERSDFLNILMQITDKSTLEGDEKSVDENTAADNTLLSMAEASAQAFIFFLAGYETSSSTATYCLLELAMNPDAQEKLQREIDEMMESPDGFTYDNLLNMEYLDMVLNETLRKHAPISFLNRLCIEDFAIPDTDYTIPKGMRVLVSSLGLQNNPEHFPNPTIFDPTRFTKENMAKRHPYLNLGFGEGPRNCIGKRFGLLQTKQVLVTLLYNYTFYICDKTILPLKFSTPTFVRQSNHGIYLRLKKRREC